MRAREETELAICESEARIEAQRERVRELSGQGRYEQAHITGTLLDAMNDHLAALKIRLTAHLAVEWLERSPPPPVPVRADLTIKWAERPYGNVHIER